MVTNKKYMPDANDEELAALAAEAARVATCRQCDLSRTRTHAVFGAGNFCADVFLIGEAPGRHEDEEGLPFVGAAGKNLDTLLSCAHLTREEIFIGNIVKCRPPKNRNPYTSEISACTPYLVQQLNLIKPRVIVPLGNFATQFILQTKEPISCLRGRIIKRSETSPFVFPVFHPAAALYDRKKQRVLEEDFKTLGKWLQQTHSNPRKKTLITNHLKPSS